MVWGPPPPNAPTNSWPRGCALRPLGARAVPRASVRPPPDASLCPRRLEALREKVRVYAASDPERLKGHTESSKNKDDAEVAPVHYGAGHGYSDKALFKDQRCALRPGPVPLACWACK